VGHIGMSWGPYWTFTNNRRYSDYAIGISGGWRRMMVLAEAINTHGYKAVDRGAPLSGKVKLLLSVGVAFSSASD
jgi:hypothetical protein